MQYLDTKHWMFSKAIFSVTFSCFSYPESMHSDVVDRVLSLPECVSVCRGWWVARCSRCTDNDWTRRGPDRRLVRSLDECDPSLLIGYGWGPLFTELVSNSWVETTRSLWVPKSDGTPASRGCVKSTTVSPPDCVTGITTTCVDSVKWKPEETTDVRTAVSDVFTFKRLQSRWWNYPGLVQSSMPVREFVLGNSVFLTLDPGFSFLVTLTFPHSRFRASTITLDISRSIE